MKHEQAKAANKPVVLNPDDVVPFMGVCGRVWRLINPETAPVKAISTALITLEAYRQSTPHYHKTIEELYYVLGGRGRLKVGNDTYPIGRDTIVYIPVNLVHSIISTGRKGLRLLVIDYPPYDPGDTYYVDGS